jgi:hypothetical protein
MAQLPPKPDDHQYVTRGRLRRLEDDIASALAGQLLKRDARIAALEIAIHALSGRSPHG